jgi:hypothetical protein
MGRSIQLLISFLLFGKFLLAQTPVETFTTGDEFTLDTHGDNGADFANAIVSNKGAIYYAYIDGALNGCIAKKDANGSITTAVVRPGMTLDNHHFEISIAIDAEGYIHWAGDMHQSNIIYYRSNKPEDINSFTAYNFDYAIGGMYGINGHGVSYGRFITSRKGTLFYVSRVRLGAVADGWVPGGQGGHIQVYNTDSKRWTQLGSLNYSFLSDKGATIIGGMDAQHQMKAVFWDNSGAGEPPFNGYQGYKIRIVFDRNNRMHMVWNVAKNPLRTTVSDTHTHLMYAYSDDEGITWKKSDGSSLTLPITTNNGEVIYMEDPNINAQRMGNFCNIALTNDNKPIIVQQSFAQNKVLVFRFDGFGWIDVSDSWNPAWFSEAITDGNGWITVVAGGNVLRRSNDNGNTFRNYAGFPITYFAGLMSFDDQFLLETGKLRYQFVSGNSSSVKTVSWSNSASAQIPIPLITPASGTVFTNSASVSISCDEWNATIRYTTDGSFPTETNGTIYTGPFTVNETTTVKSRAFMSGRVASRLSASQIVKFVADNTPPTTPNGLLATEITTKSFVLQWNLSTDNVGVTGYQVYRNNVLLGTSVSPNFTLNGLLPLTTYSMQVRAFDAQNNYSQMSAPLLVTTATNEATIGKTTQGIFIDGNKEAAWYGPVYGLDIINAGSVGSEPDLSGSWTALFDQDFIYFYVDVNDDEQSSNKPNWYENDGVEIYIDAINRRGTSYQSTDFQFNYMIGDIQLRERSKGISTSGSEVAKVDKPGGYRVEMKIPWTVLGISPPAQGYKIGMDVMLIDNDGGAWQGKRAWINTADNSWNNPSTFGVANFGGTLPLKLLRFQGKPVNQEVQLEWTTAAEEKFRGFELYRSLDGLHFEPISSMIAGGQTSYRYTDRVLPAVRNLFYKLRMIDLDGSARWSPVIAVPLRVGNASFQVMPNPVSAKALVLWAGGEEVKLLRMLDMNGGTVAEYTPFGSSHQIDMSHLSKGMYWIIALDKAGKQVHFEKLIKQ